MSVRLPPTLSELRSRPTGMPGAGCVKVALLATSRVFRSPPTPIEAPGAGSIEGDPVHRAGAADVDGAGEVGVAVAQDRVDLAAGDGDRADVEEADRPSGSRVEGVGRVLGLLRDDLVDLEQVSTVEASTTRLTRPPEAGKARTVPPPITETKNCWPSVLVTTAAWPPEATCVRIGIILDRSVRVSSRPSTVGRNSRRPGLMDFARSFAIPGPSGRDPPSRAGPGRSRPGRSTEAARLAFSTGSRLWISGREPAGHPGFARPEPGGGPVARVGAVVPVRRTLRGPSTSPLALHAATSLGENGPIRGRPGPCARPTPRPRPDASSPCSRRSRRGSPRA